MADLLTIISETDPGVAAWSILAGMFGGWAVRIIVDKYRYEKRKHDDS